MKILVTGANGQLGKEIAGQYGMQHELVLADREMLDITNEQRVRETLAQIKPQAVIHCAAYTQVDAAESDADGAFRVNVIGTGNIAAACLEQGARMVYVSTDYVFDGKGDRFYREYDPVNPLNEYGRTKFLGEQLVKEILGRHYIVRTAWLYGEGPNFVRTMLRLGREKEQLEVVNDQIGSPTFTKDVVDVIFRLLATDAYGTYHASAQGACSWYEFACEIFKLAGCTIPVLPVPTEQFPRPAHRPAYSVLDNYYLRLGIGDSFRPWQEALTEYLKREGY